MIDIQYLRVKRDLFSQPVDIFSALTNQGKQKHSLMLESGEPGSSHCNKSILITESALVIKLKSRVLEFQACTENGMQLIKMFDLKNFPDSFRNHEYLKIQLVAENNALTLDEQLSQVSIFSPLRELFNQCLPLDNNSAKAFMLAGVLGFDLIDYFEKINVETRNVPEHLGEDDFYLLVPESRILIDHIHKNYFVEQLVVQPQQNIHLYHQAKSDLERIDQSILAIENQPFNLKNSLNSSKAIDVDCNQVQFGNIVEKAKTHIEQGDIFQVVPSRTFSCFCNNPLSAYQTLCQQNPSPYQFYLVMDELTLFGASPESAVKYSTNTNEVEIYPIAGTISRGRGNDGILNPDLDNCLEAQLKLDQKELSEHMMLVDLARNDVARISKTGTRQVKELLNVDKYSQVMHLVSKVTGELDSNLDAFHAYQCCLNMGTLTGAPKIRATEIIRELEQHKRGLYGGAIGYFDLSGDMDTAIVIRSAIVKKDTAYVTAGAGIVADSIPGNEARETSNKAAAVINAINGASVEALYL